MKQLRVELRLSVIVHVGDDIAEGAAPDRTPDATEAITLTRVSHLGERIAPRDAAAETLIVIMCNGAPVIGERLRHNLRTKSL